MNAHVPRRSAPLSGWLGLVLVLLAVLLGASTAVAEASAPEAPASSDVVAGTPSAVATASSARADSPAEPLASAARAFGTPPDHPHVGSKVLELPAPPSSFNTHDAGWIRFAYPPNTRERVQPLIRKADAFRAELAARLGQPVLDAVRVYVARTPGEMSTLAPPGAPYPRYASGVAYSQIGLILLTIATDPPNADYDLTETFKHELAHVALFDALGKQQSVPRWFNEGFAVHASGESSLARLQTLWTATLSGNLMPLSRLEMGFPSDGISAQLAYAESADLVRFLMRQQDAMRFASLIGRVRQGEPFDAAMRDAYGLDRASLEYEWREDVARRYSFWPVFFSGSLVWMGMIGLFVLGWRRRRKRARATLDRWTREEALEDARRARAAAALQQAPAPEGAGRIHIVFPASRGLEIPRAVEASRSSEPEIPKVEHDGNWHTLH